MNKKLLLLAIAFCFFAGNAQAIQIDEPSIKEIQRAIKNEIESLDPKGEMKLEIENLKKLSCIRKAPTIFYCKVKMRYYLSEKNDTSKEENEEDIEGPFQYQSDGTWRSQVY